MVRDAHRPHAASPDAFEAELSIAAGRALLRLQGELDLSAREHLNATLARCGECDVTVDLEHVRFMDCSAYTALAEAARNLEAGGHELRLVRASGNVERMLDVLGQVSRARAHEPGQP